MIKFGASFLVPGSISAIEIDHKISVILGGFDFSCEILDLERGSRRVRVSGETKDPHALKQSLDAALLPTYITVWTVPPGTPGYDLP